MFEFIIWISLALIAASSLLLMIRLIKGPSVPDRAISLDAIGINLVGITAIMSIVLDTSAFLDIILLIGILAFIGTVSIAKFLEKGEIIENDRNNQ
ncbi:MAG: Na(+)/H(+) antiporter subunit F1 [Bacillaceae bacterium]|jgi:Multisubunit Na+/H+ antiporter, MnhF subunit|uniref:Na(+)/H(+) antiporter subunit F1 n=1 Tax=Aeribacillus TaxID=1055323 RepID=UPI0007B4D8A9|nr:MULTISPECIES: Na(+)/H(+) antiporter subunit F1 [Aeribacillus]REJ18691.1 MAG: Na(+)/H(+) antiporter subunit F1 [Bacillaceae bacterium]KZM55288.1 cation:proton antiporter [Aeribacillus pallidus]MDR9792033.1 Na(+)/H(+) antiporter subunit F1 [Aeribacillus pallidus]MDR9797700.1 Na(+)/H(+) antiporter subunit F1 [Aeribacillus pallidus]MED0651597.1 Na(+)/H(+) antiporter subunit F1 [Aeribacillus composti]